METELEVDNIAASLGDEDDNNKADIDELYGGLESAGYV